MVCTDRLNQLFVTSFNISDSIMGTRILRMILKKEMIMVFTKAVRKLGMVKIYRNCCKPTKGDSRKPIRGLKSWKAITRPKIGRYAKKVVNSTAGISII